MIMAPVMKSFFPCKDVFLYFFYYRHLLPVCYLESPLILPVMPLILWVIV